MANTIPGPHPVDPPLPATKVVVTAGGANNLAGGDLQAVLDALATRVRALEPA